MAERQEEPPADWTAAMAPRPATLAAVDDALLRRVAAAIVGRGLAAPAVLWLDSLRPLSFLGSQAMHFLTPLARLVASGDAFGRLAVVLEERAHLDRLLQHIEVLAARDDPAPPEA